MRKTTSALWWFEHLFSYAERKREKTDFSLSILARTRQLQQFVQRVPVSLYCTTRRVLLTVVWLVRLERYARILRSIGVALSRRVHV